VVLAYYILDDWKCREVPLGFERIPCPHTGCDLVQIMEYIITQFNLTDCLLLITCDKASNNSTLCPTLEDALWSQDVE
jgi:hypothetical protein